MIDALLQQICPENVDDGEITETSGSPVEAVLREARPRLKRKGARVWED